MVAYSFKRMFVPAIRIGLGLDVEDPEPGARRAKLQTIRAMGRRRHARAGDELQLYCGMRTRQCELIGRSLCVGAPPIGIRFAKPHRPVERVEIDGSEIRFAADLDRFAEGDGFETWGDLRAFWRANHPGVLDFNGVLVRWEPLSA